MTKPIRPEDVPVRKAARLPPQVIEAFNELIVLHYDGETARVPRDQAVNLIFLKLNTGETTYIREEVFANKWLDIEDAYRMAGWKVEYDQPSIGDTYKAHFVFSRHIGRPD